MHRVLRELDMAGPGLADQQGYQAPIFMAEVVLDQARLPVRNRQAFRRGSCTQGVASSRISRRVPDIYMAGLALARLENRYYNSEKALYSISVNPAAVSRSFCLLAFAHCTWALSPFILRPISPADGITYNEAPLVADIDHDGDLGFFMGKGRSGKSFWYEHGTEGWTRHLASDSNAADVGAALLDVDGWMDKVSSGFWYRNPGFPTGGLPAVAPRRGFTVCRHIELEYIHDLYTADFNGDGRSDVLAIDYDGIRWYRTPPVDSTCGLWEEVMINGTTDSQQHGGIAAGDIDGDGDTDVSRLDRWYENADGRGKTWVEHANIPFVPLLFKDGWGISGRALIFDLDGDGHNDLVQTDCDAPNGRVAWYANPEGNGLRWVEHVVKDSTDGQDFHSLIAADFDGDGDKDLFTAGAGNSFGKPKSYIWENLDGHGGA